MNKKNVPKFVFETSWEVCNKVGGIYTVLSTRANTLKKKLNENLIFIGPDVWTDENPSPYFKEDPQLHRDWKKAFYKEAKLKTRVGYWDVPGEPITILVDFQPLYAQKDEIYARIYSTSGVESLQAYGDYDESSMFGFSTGLVIESFFNYHGLSKRDNVVAHFNEWMTTFGAFHLKENSPEIATIFTTHATTIGRSIAGNNKPLYNYLDEYDGDQMAFELNVVSKHSAEKKCAQQVDCFTTVSDITAKECEHLLDMKPHLVTPNGFEDDFVPTKGDFNAKRIKARKALRKVAETIIGSELEKDVLMIATAGRYEYKNKGIDIFIESLRKLEQTQKINREIVAFIMVPAHIKGARKDLQDKLTDSNAPMDYWNKHTTHELYDYANDNVVQSLRWFHFTNKVNERVKVIFVPSYLNGNDGIFNLSYYELLIGMDLTVFPSYYEPWGYTPLESIAFSIPTVTTDLSGFGLWSPTNDIKRGVAATHRSDYNSAEVVKNIAETIGIFNELTQKQTQIARESAFRISQKAHWDKFIKYYDMAYSIGLKNRTKRLQDSEAK